MLTAVGYAESADMTILIYMCAVDGHRRVMVKMSLRDGSGRFLIPSPFPPTSHRSHNTSTSINPFCFCCAVMLIRTSASRAPADCCVGLGSQITYTNDTFPYMARESQVARRRGFPAAEHSLLRLLNRHTLSHIWLFIRPKQPRTLCTVHHRLLRVPGPLAVPLSTFQAMWAPPSDSSYGKA